MSPLKKTHTFPHALISGALSSGLLLSAFGAGFQLAERSTIGLGRAYSGESAIADDASVLASNPAGMMLLDGTQVTIGVQAIYPSVEVSATNKTRAGLGEANASASTNTAAPDAYIPNLYLTHRINDQWSIGVGSFGSFGLKTNYSDGVADVIGSQDSEIFSATLNPAIAYKVNDLLSLGAGVNMTYVTGKITSTSSRGFLNGTPVDTFSFDLTGDDLAFSFNVGALLQVTKKTRVGLHYRSTIDLDVKGSAEVGGQLNPALAGDFDANLAIELPDTLELSVYHELNDRWAVHGDILWTFWSKFKTLAPTLDSPININDSLETPENWNDSYRLSVGTTYKHSDKLTLRGGVAWDKSPVDDEFRTFRIPDAERYWVSIGASYHVSEQLTLDAAYTHVFTEPGTIVAGHELATGETEGSVNLFGIGATYRF